MTRPSRSAAPSLAALALLATLAGAEPGAAAPETFVIDPNHSEVTFQVRHLMVSNVRGRFETFGGKIVLDEANPSASSVVFTVKTESISTAHAKRDADLRGPEHFDVANSPEMTFKSTRAVRQSDTLWEITGDLTIRGTTRQLVLPVTYNGRVNTPWGTTRIGFETQTDLSRQDFGLTWNRALEAGGVMVSDKVKVSLAIEAELQKPAAP